MNKIWVGFAFCCIALFCFSLEAGSVKVAIWGDSKEAESLADSVIANLSKDRNISFFERKELNKVFREQGIQKFGVSSKEAVQLSKFVHVDLFVVISSGAEDKSKKNRSSSLVIFNAKNGFRLCDSTLDEDFENNEKKIIESAKSAVRKIKRPKSLKLLSVLSVRNIGAPEKFNFKLAAMVAEIERKLSLSPNVAVLERDNLFQVNKERKLSKETYKLAPSAILLDFELSPGKEEDIANLALYVMKPSGKIIKKLRAPNCMSRIDATVKAMVRVVNKILRNRKKIEDSSSPEMEAKRFYREFKYCERLGSMDAAARNLEAAVCLAPDKPEYRIELAFFLIRKAQRRVRGMSREKHLDLFLKNAKMAADILVSIKTDFPNYKKRVYENVLGNLLMPLQNVFINLRDRSKAQDVEAKKIADLLRPGCLEEARRYYYKFDLKKGIKDLKEMKTFSRYESESSNYAYYMNAESYVDASFRNSLELVRVGSDFLRRNPGMAENLSPNAQMEFIPLLFSFGLGGEGLSFFESQLKKSDDLIAAAKSHPLPVLRVYGFSVDFLRKSALSSYDMKSARENAEWLSGALKKIKLSQKDIESFYSASIGWFQPFAIFYKMKHNEFYSFYILTLINSLKEKKLRLSFWLLRDYLRSLKPLDLANAVIALKDDIDYFRKSKSQVMKDDFKRNCDFLSNERLKPLKDKNTELYQKAYSILKPGRKQYSLKRLEDIGDFSYKGKRAKHPEFLNAIEKDGCIHLLIGSRNDACIAIFSIAKKSFQVLGNLNLALKKIDHLDEGWHRPFAVDKENFFIADKGRIIVVDRKNFKVSIIDNLPVDQVTGLAVLEERVYAFLGRINYSGNMVAKEDALFSCRVDGSDRKVHISSMRREKKGFFDKMKPFVVSALFADEKKKRLIFMAESGLWEYFPASSKHRQLFAFNHPCVLSWAGRNGNIIYFSGGGNYECNCSYDINTDKVDFILFRDQKKYAKRLKMRPHYICDMNQQPPFFTTKSCLWFGGYRTVFAYFDKLEDQVQIEGMGRYRYTRGTLFFPCSDGVSVIAATKLSLFKITPLK